MKNKVPSIFLILISVAVLASVASAAQITKIGTGYYPEIYCNKVTWSDDTGSIHIYDLTANKDVKISSSQASHPAICGNKLVWHDESSGTPRLTVYDIPSGSRSYITKDVDSSSIPAIYGKRIVWSANGGVYLRDISTCKQTKIGSGNEPDICDTKVVYISTLPDTYSVQMYDINTKKTITVDSGGVPTKPHIWGTKVIWADASNGKGYIAMYDTSTKKTIDVTHRLDYDPQGNEYGATTGTHFDIQNDKIVYNKFADDYEGKSGIYMYSIASGKSTLLIEYPQSPYGPYKTPEVYGNKIVWGDESFGDRDPNIYVCDLVSKSGHHSM